MKVTLIYPAVGRKEGKPYVRAWQMQPLSMAVLASLMPPNVEVTFFDDRMECIDYEVESDLVVISVETFTGFAHTASLHSIVCVMLKSCWAVTM